MEKYEDKPDPFKWKKWNKKYPNPDAYNGKLKYHPEKPEKEKGVLYHILKQTDRETVNKIFDDIEGE